MKTLLTIAIVAGFAVAANAGTTHAAKATTTTKTVEKIFFIAFFPFGFLVDK